MNEISEKAVEAAHAAYWSTDDGPSGNDRPAMRVALTAALPHLMGEVEDCETCNGVGWINDKFAPFSLPNPKAPCPDCDGTGRATGTRQPGIREDWEDKHEALIRIVCDFLDSLPAHYCPPNRKYAEHIKEMRAHIANDCIANEARHEHR